MAERDSPMARALLGKCIEDVIEVKLPDQTAQFVLLEVSYRN